MNYSNMTGSFPEVFNLNWLLFLKLVWFSPMSLGNRALRRM